MSKKINRLLLKLQNPALDRIFRRTLIRHPALLMPLSVLLGALCTLGFAPYSAWPVLICAFSLFFWLLANLKRRLQIFTAVLLFFTAMNTLTLSWLNFVMEDFGQLPLILSWLIEIAFSLYLALPYALLALLAVMLARRRSVAFILCFLPAAFVIADFIVGALFTGFPWMYAGYAALDGPLSAYAPLIGVRGINLIIYLAAAGLALTATRRFIFLPVPGFIFIVGILCMGISFTRPAAPPIKTSLVQGNIAQSVKWDLDQVVPTLNTYWKLSRDLLTENSLVVWPESAIPLFIEQSLPILDDLNQAAAAPQSWLVTGIQHRDLASKQNFNSIIVLGRGQNLMQLQRYDKRQLVPFGEILPFADTLRPLGKIFNFPMSGFTQGPYVQAPLIVRDIKFTPVICYESIFPELIRALNTKDSGGMLMISNDSWFGDTRGPLQHVSIARMRAKELQKPMLRATNSGHTVYIDAKGNIVSALPPDTASVLSVNFTPYRGLTPYARFGNLFLYLIMLILTAGGFFAAWKKENPQVQALEHLIRP